MRGDGVSQVSWSGVQGQLRTSARRSPMNAILNSISTFRSARMAIASIAISCAWKKCVSHCASSASRSSKEAVCFVRSRFVMARSSTLIARPTIKRFSPFVKWSRFFSGQLSGMGTIESDGTVCFFPHYFWLLYFGGQPTRPTSVPRSSKTRWAGPCFQPRGSNDGKTNRRTNPRASKQTLGREPPPRWPGR
jgi:hypothetical protein